MEETAGRVLVADLFKFLERDGEGWIGGNGRLVFGCAADLLGFAGRL